MGTLIDIYALMKARRIELESEICTCDKKIYYHAMMAETDLETLYREKRRVAIEQLKGILEYQTRPREIKQKVEKVGFWNKLAHAFCRTLPI